jgi:hypothetical protein
MVGNIWIGVGANSLYIDYEQVNRGMKNDSNLDANTHGPAAWNSILKTL